MAEIKSIKKVSYGHFEITVEQINCKRKYPFGLSSVTTWKYTTNDTMLIDDFNDDNYAKSNKAKKILIKLTKLKGIKTIKK